LSPSSRGRLLLSSVDDVINDLEILFSL
jgi:hypothetical protein